MRLRLLPPLMIAVMAAAACAPAAPVAPAATTLTTVPPIVATTGSTIPPGTVPTTPPTTTAFVPAPHPLRIDGDAFVSRATGEEFVVRGTNYFLIVPTGGGWHEDRFFSPAEFDAATIRRDFTRLAAAGYNTVRLFLDSCSTGRSCIGNQLGPGLNPGYLDVIADVMDIAADTGIMLLLTSNDLPKQGGYWQISDRDNSSVFPGYRNSHYLTPSGTTAAVAYWNDLLDGLAERQARFDTVLGWSIVNEQWLFKNYPPLSLTSGLVTTATGTYDMGDPDEKKRMVVDNVRSYIAAVAAVIKQHHPSALVTMGFFAPQFPNGTSIGGDWYVDTAPLVTESALDFFDFHAYLGSDITIAQIAENFGITDAKPVVMGEVGAFVDKYPDPTGVAWRLQAFIADSCAAGYDGWIQWGYLQAPKVIGDAAWGLVDNDGALLRDLSPAKWPDPCTPTLTNPNLAAGATVITSRALPDEPATNAVDGTPAQWGSGGDAPQWIEIDLGRLAIVSAIRLTVAQWPSGRTVHRVRWAGEDRRFTDTNEIRFDGDTTEGDVLTREWSSEQPTMRYIRILTVTSPSWVAWREVEVYGTFAP